MSVRLIMIIGTKENCSVSGSNDRRTWWVDKIGTINSSIQPTRCTEIVPTFTFICIKYSMYKSKITFSLIEIFEK